jgi:outer membrane cobalamin receptor
LLKKITFIISNSKLILLLIILCNSAISQQLFNKSGLILDAKTNAPIVGASILVNDKNAAVSDANGSFSIALNNQVVNIEVRALGYVNYKIALNNESAEEILKVKLTATETLLNQVVVSGSRFEKLASEEIAAVQVVKPWFLQNNNVVAVDEAINKLPGIEVNDGQASIRGGSGWSYGAGSRVLILVDDMPMLTADAGDLKWDFLPIENCEQIEVLKGAASSLYGSSALNGVIHFRTARPQNIPKTKISYFTNFTGAPNYDSSKWWGNYPPLNAGLNFFHSRKIKNLELTIGGNAYSDFEHSYLQGDYTTRYRANINLKYISKKISGLVYGINANSQNSAGQLFFYWAGDSMGMFKPFGGLSKPNSTLSAFKNKRTNIDPYITYTNTKGFKISTRTRYFLSNNQNNNLQNSKAEQFYIEQVFQKQFYFNLTLVGGIVTNFSKVKSELFGNHNGGNSATYLQIEKKIMNKLWLSGGWRYEIFKTDEITGTSGNVWRSGFNYQLFKGTYCRASYGMGYRFPTIAERYVNTTVGAAKVIPNPTLKPEKGNNLEVGIKQIVKWKSLLAYLDVALFNTQYQDMTEFNFGLHYPNYILANPSIITIDTFVKYLGFKSINVTNAVIKGIDVTLAGQCKIVNQLQLNWLTGFTYIDPKDKSFFDPNYRFQKIQYSDTSNNILKYRNRFTTKTDIEVVYKAFTLGTNFRYLSAVNNIDAIFENPAVFNVGIKEYRARHLKGDYLWDARFFYQINETIRVGLIAKNILNWEYVDRPANPQQPRNITFQAVFTF